MCNPKSIMIVLLYDFSQKFFFEEWGQGGGGGGGGWG